MSELVEEKTAAAPRHGSSLAPTVAKRFNILVASGRVFAFRWAGRPAALHFTALDAAAHATGFLRVRLGDHLLDLGYNALPAPSQLGVDFAGIEIEGLPDTLRLGCLEACLEDALTALRQHGVALELQGWQPAAETLPAQFGWELRLEGAPFLAGTVHGESEACEYLATLAERATPRPVRSAADIPFAVDVAVARMILSVTALRDLAPGDVLLPNLSAAEWASGRCELWSGNRRLGAAVREKQTVKLHAMKQTTPTPPPPGTAAALSVDDLPVQIAFDVGQIEVTVGHLRTLGDGYTFELPAAPERTVTIRANGREIGHGELVDLGDKMGVRIASWNLA
ncbi:MAG: hypothetical protein RIQ93_953 [Verrucomicrobiota bacterium]|jgi:type III secretion protein Q